MKAKDLSKILRKLADPARAEHSLRFFKTGKGEYGEGDMFLGIRVPALREQVKKHRELSMDAALELLKSPYHEERLFALLLMADKFRKGTEKEKEAIYRLYLKNTKFINNWDLVDLSAHLIVGGWLENRDREPLRRLARSENLWERRIAIISTFQFIRKKDFDDAFAISSILVDDSEDLIHKAVGWMLREIGKRDIAAEKAFLKKHYRTMPRTMLRYAIEKFPEKERKAWLRGEAV